MSIVVLDFGSQYTRLITRRLRELSVYSVILPSSAPLQEILAQKPQAIVLSGGPRSVFDPDAPRSDPGLLGLDLPILGICYGMHLLAHQLGGEIQRTGHREYGKAILTTTSGRLFEGLEAKPSVWMSHSDAIVALPRGWRVTAATKDNPIAAIEAEEGLRFGVQFHPEVAHTPMGIHMLDRFLAAAGIPRDWTPQRTLDILLAQLKEQVGKRRVLIAVSGGVDSSTLALLLAKAGIAHTAVFVDHGLLREEERAQVKQALGALGVHLVTVDASTRFLSALSGVSDPEKKRKIIGRSFIEVFDQQARELGPFEFLAQGTLYPDVIESAGVQGAANIKSHHNVGGLPKELGFELVEPFRFLFKDEVRKLASLLGLPDGLRLRHPFPGPGLAIRIIGEVTPKRLRILREADDIFIRALIAEDLYSQTWQALAVLTPVHSVGVVGDERSYGHVLALRAVTSSDGMTADWARLPYDFLDRVAAAITRQIPEIGRVVYDISSKPPATIEWE